MLHFILVNYLLHLGQRIFMNEHLRIQKLFDIGNRLLHTLLAYLLI